MAPTLLSLQPHSPTFLLHSSKLRDNPLNNIHSNIISRRSAIVGTILLAKEVTFNVELARAGFDLRMTVPDQTIEEAESTIKSHERDLRDVKILLDSESWREAQKALRKSSSLLKQDIYTIIQAKPGSERPLLRQLYSQLFNNVTKVNATLDYAARSKDTILVQECYKNIIEALDNIMSRL